MAANKIACKNFVFDKTLIHGNCLLSHSDLSDSLAADVLEFDTWHENAGLMQGNPNDPMSYFYFDERIGTFYVKSVERTGKNTYHFTALSAMGRLMGATHYGGMYSGVKAKELIEDICAAAGVSVSIKTAYQSLKLYGWLPVASARDNLSQVLFAIGASLRTLSTGELRVTSLYAGPSWVRGPERCFIGGSVEYTSPVARIFVAEHRWMEGGEQVTLFEGASDPEVLIRFEEPVYDLQAQGFEILDSNCNYARLSVGTGVLTGIKYVHNLRDITRPVPGVSQGKDVTVKDAYLVSLVNAAGVARRLANYYSYTERIAQDAIWEGQRPGDIVRTTHPYGGTAEIFLSSADLTMSGLLRSSEEGVVGYRPPSPEIQEYYDHVEILSGVGEWTPPDGVSSVTAVLIGSGTGGFGGNPGKKGGLGKKGSVYNEDFGYTSYISTPGLGGDGGAGGAPGAPGKVLQVTIDLNGSTPIPYACHAGGVGGRPGATGAAGQPTVFGALSSESGTVQVGGYSDPISGTRYALPGTAGINGGKGSGAGSQSIPGWSIVSGNTVRYQGVDYKPGNTGQYGPGYGGGLGGGAAAGQNGGDGRSNNGGTGATPIQPPPKTRIGDGGDGGHGGGGGGGIGSMTNRNESFVGGGTPANGGAGGLGGQGGPGGILLFYSIPKAVHSGRFLAKGGTPFFSAKRRIFAV